MGFMNLLRKCAQIKDELGQSYIYLFEKLLDCHTHTLDLFNGLVLSFSITGEAAYVALTLM
jgi:hypothetical protein